jgi:formate hydrogenlyase transcriptional activator
LTSECQSRRSNRHSATAWAGSSLAVCALATLTFPASAEDPARPRSVLKLSARRSTSPTTVLVEQVFSETLEKNLGSPIDFHVEYLDLPGAMTDSYERRHAELLAEKYAGRPIEVVVAEESEALRYLLNNRKTLFPGVPIVFSDVPRSVLEAMRPPPDVTGALLVIEGQRTVNVALDLHPDAKRVVIIAGASDWDLEAAAIARRFALARAPGLETLSLAGLPLEELLQRVARLPEHSVAIMASYRADTSGRALIPHDVLRRISRAANAPVYGPVATWLGYGIVGGDLIQYDVLAERAAALTARILRGEAPASIPPIELPSSAHMFDWRELRRWGIDERRLPEGSVVRFRERTLWSEYRWHIVGVSSLVLVQGFTIAALLAARRRRIRDQAGLREAEARYRTVADFTHDWEYWTRPDGSFAYISPSCERVTGYAAARFEQRPALLAELVLDEDRPGWEAHRRAAAASGLPSGFVFRIRAPGGETRWIEHVCRPVTSEDGRDLGVRGSNRDVTERKRSEDEIRRAFAEIEQLKERLEADNTYLKEELWPERGIQGLVGTSNALRYVVAKAQQVAPTTSTVLLQGETGVGKGIVAHALHDLSPRSARPLVTLNCAALPPSLVESELFGHEKGAFTGAHSLRKGRFEIADGSTLFLDEIGELPLELQAKLLRAVQDGEFERVGGSVTFRTDVRLVVATNRRLDEEVKAGRFREDLWYRLNVFPITVPPLRQRREDIPLLVGHFVEKHCRKLGRPLLEVTKAALKDLQARDWLGNVRELESTLERAVISSPGSLLQVTEDFPGPSQSVTAPQGSSAGTAQTLIQRERDQIVATLDRVYWRLEGEGGAAELLGINPSTLRGRMRKHGIRRPGSRPVPPS